MFVDVPGGMTARIWRGGVTVLCRPRTIGDHVANVPLRSADALDPELGPLGFRWRTMTGRRELATITQRLREQPANCPYPWIGAPPLGVQ